MYMQEELRQGFANLIAKIALGENGTIVLYSARSQGEGM